MVQNELRELHRREEGVAGTNPPAPAPTDNHRLEFSAPTCYGFPSLTFIAHQFLSLSCRTLPSARSPSPTARPLHHHLLDTSNLPSYHCHLQASDVLFVEGAVCDLPNVPGIR